MRSKIVALGAIVPVVLLLDLATKSWALDALAGGRQIELAGGLLPLTLAFNRGAAFGIEFGSDPRVIFIPITILALVLLSTLFLRANPDDRLRHVALALVLAGALGNLYDRIRWTRGVVDFVGPIDLGFWNFPIFNVADMAITCGAILLAISFWQEERAEARARAAAGVAQEAAVERDGPAEPAPDAGPVIES